MKQYVLPGAILVALFVGSKMLTKKDKPAPKEPQTMEQVRGQEISRKEIDPPNKVEAQTATESREDVKKQCDESIKQMVTPAYDRILEELKRGVYQFRAECQVHDPAASLGIYKACKFDPERGELFTPEPCQQALGLYRAMSLARFTEDQTDYRRLSLPLLLNKIMGSLMANDPKLHAEVLKMLDEVIAREPNSYPARKAKVIVMFQGDYDLETKRQNIADAMRLNPNDTELIEAYLVTEGAASKGNLENYLAKNPDSALGHYHLARLEWENSPETALILLRRAAQLAPGDARIQKTLRLAEARTKGKIFEVVLGVRFDGM